MRVWKHELAAVASLWFKLHDDVQFPFSALLLTGTASLDGMNA
jgi:hypothetical protein